MPTAVFKRKWCQNGAQHARNGGARKRFYIDVLQNIMQWENAHVVPGGKEMHAKSNSAGSETRDGACGVNGHLLVSAKERWGIGAILPE